MTFSYLTPDNIFDRYDAAKTYTERLTQPFQEFERIARNRPLDGIDKRYPRTTDGTTASIIRKTPKRVIQQLPTGTVITEDNGWLGIVAGYIFSEKIVRKANEEYDLIQKCWSIIEKGLTFGAGISYTPFLSHDGEFTTDLTLPYWGDVFVQPGKKSIHSSKYLFMRSWFQKEDIEAILAKEQKLSKNAKRRGEQYDSSWDRKELKKLLNEKSQKDASAMTPSERDRQVPADGIELITGFQVGVEGQFFTFYRRNKSIVRTKVNKDPRGRMPIDVMYGDIDGSNPFGRGIVELIGGIQNLIDADMQMYQYNRALMLNPPVVKRGDFSKAKVVFEPNRIIDIGNNPNNSLEPLSIDSSAVINYPALYGLQKSQLLNLVNSPDTSISSDAGNPSFSKTDAGVKSQQATISVDDNYVAKMFEAWFQNWGETAINLYFAERSGVEELQLDKATANKLRDLPNFDQNLLSPDNKIRLDYDSATPALKFRVDPSTSKKKDGEAQVQVAMQLLDMVEKYPALNANFGGTIDPDVLARRIVVNSGIDDPEQVAPELTEQQKQAKEQAKNKPNAFSPMYDKPQLRINSADLSPEQLSEVLATAGISTAPPASPEQQPQEPAIKLSDIYKSTTDPIVKAQIEQLSGLTPNPTHIQNQLETNASQHVADQVGNLTQSAANLAPPPPTDPNQPDQASPAPEAAPAPQPAPAAPEAPQDAQLSPLDQQLIQHLQALGVPDQLIQEAIQMAEQGATPQQILQAIGLSHG